MKIKGFNQYLTEESKTVYFTFGRFNPPTIGHGKLLDKLSRVARRDPYFVFTSQSTDSKKNPLDYQQKVKHIRKMFPKYARSVMINKKVKNAFDAVAELYDQGYKNLVMVVGGDRVREFDVLLNKYNGVKARHGFYNFESIKVVSAGERDPDADDVTGMSASKQRENAKQNDFPRFSQGLPKSMNNREARKLFNDIRVGMGLSEENQVKKNIVFDPVSEERERYIKEGIFKVGNLVRLKEDHNASGRIKKRGANYLLVDFFDLERNKMVWIEDVEEIPDTFQESNDPVEKARKKINKEKEADAYKHDKMMDRARIKATRMKNSKKRFESTYHRKYTHLDEAISALTGAQVSTPIRDFFRSTQGSTFIEHAQNNRLRDAMSIAKRWFGNHGTYAKQAQKLTWETLDLAKKFLRGGS